MAGNQEYFNRRLHSLLGIIPIGIFLVMHLSINYFATRGAESFNQAAHFMENLPFRYAMEIFIIFLPILYHGIYGIYIAFTAKNNIQRYGTFRNWMFALQRFTGVFLLIFITWHVYETRFQAALGNAEVNYNMMADILSSPFMLVFYIVGVISATFHLANGLWSFLVSWGITVTPRSQRIATYATIALFLALTYVGLSATFAFINPELANM
ncbi:succinate dehydrogenase cytochrome b558 subunit [Alkalihalobacillus pseudalcaliphilus]|uniref:succinate dehydrogenase cytochrome b558 subunit n=1 Tax=Alkalihalobacillus pseudalcaliphilus TaxID=79884 RepID=UPI00064E092E|nr:succinate dehydrogenase cytochrome b558 subunit [Alkalihalobacillus pseudalcaliphilus]KMK74605.1 succinate dehydrogenase [Alkalihalobacillus pseudalcaliphilus]